MDEEIQYLGQGKSGRVRYKDEEIQGRRDGEIEG